MRIARSAENIIWSLSSSKSDWGYIPLVASIPGLTYFYDNFVEGFIMVDGTVSTGLGIILYHCTFWTYGQKVVGANELQMIWIPYRINMCVCGGSSFPQSAGNCS